MNQSFPSYQVGDATVTRLVDLSLPRVDPDSLFPDLDANALAEHGHRLTPGSYDAATGQFAISVHAWLVRLHGRVILVDTGVGNDKDVPGNPALDHHHGSFLELLAAAGVRPEQVDTVLLTHLHADHVGWNTRSVDGRWVM